MATMSPPDDPGINPESTSNHEPEINKRFIDIFRHEDGDEALARLVEKSLSANDRGSKSTAPKPGSRRPMFPVFKAWFQAERGNGKWEGR